MTALERVTQSLGRFDPAELDAQAGAVYALTPDFLLAYFNLQWFRFAEENGGEPGISRDWPIGRSVLDCMPVSQRNGYVSAVRICMEAGTPWVQEYECSSPTERRRHHQIGYPLENGAGILLVHSRLVDRDPAQDAPDARSRDGDYADEGGLLHQCMHCRRFRRRGAENLWDWIPGWAVAFPRATSHGLCSTCFSFHYPVRGS